MKVKELIKELQKYNPDKEVALGAEGVYHSCSSVSEDVWEESWVIPNSKNETSFRREVVVIDE